MARPSRTNFGGATRVASAVMIGCLALLAVSVQQRWGGQIATKTVDHLGVVGFAWIAAIICYLTCRRSSGPRRRSWAGLTVACVSWGAGACIWSYYELVADRATPFPSLADAGFLLFAPAAIVALWCYPGGRGGRTWLVLDGVAAATSLFLLSWLTTLGAAYHAGADGAFKFVVSLSYPLMDLALLTVVIVVWTRSTVRPRLPLALMSCGLAGMALAQSALAYLTATGRHQGGVLTDLGWSAMFVLLAIAGLVDRSPVEQVDLPAMPSRLQVLLPYAGLPVAAVVAGLQALTARPIPAIEQITLAVLAILFFLRHIVSLAENSQLVGEVKRRDEQLHHRAFHDPLTGLANRAMFDDQLRHAVELHRRDARPVAVVVVDLDDFKLVNDTLGHLAGDELLVEVAERLLACCRAADTVGHLGGDEFAVLLEAGSSPLRMAERILAAFSAPFHLAGGPVRVSSSVGLAIDSPETAELSAADILRDADLAMHAAKRRGKGALAVFSPDMRRLEEEDLALRVELRAAIELGQIHVSYQPIRDLDTQMLWGVEALARWHNDRLGELTAGRFIALAEQAGLIAALDDIVLEKALKQYASWMRTGGDSRLKLTVNISASRLSDSEYCGRVAASLARHEVPADRLIMEISETTLMTNIEAAVEIANRLHGLGIGVAIDGFGTGYSALAVLDRLPARLLKIHRSFARKAAEQNGTVLVNSIVEMSRALGMTPIAEGIETAEELRAVREVGCRLGQGYYLGRPINPDDFATLLTEPSLAEPEGQPETAEPAYATTSDWPSAQID